MIRHFTKKNMLSMRVNAQRALEQDRYRRFRLVKATSYEIEKEDGSKVLFQRRPKLFRTAEGMKVEMYRDSSHQFKGKLLGVC